MQTSGCSQHSFCLRSCLVCRHLLQHPVQFSLAFCSAPTDFLCVFMGFRLLSVSFLPLLLPFSIFEWVLKTKQKQQKPKLKTKAAVQMSVILSSIMVQVLRSRLNARVAVRSREVCLLFMNCLRCFLVVCDVSRTLWFGFFLQLHFQSGSNHYSAYKTIEHQIAIQVGGARDSEA